MNQIIFDTIISLPNLSKAYLFGSRAKGNHTKDSDYDFCIVIKDNNKEIVFKMVYEFLKNNSIFIQPLVFTEIEFKEKMKIDIYKNEIIEKGIEIKL